MARVGQAAFNAIPLPGAVVDAAGVVAHTSAAWDASREACDHLPPCGAGTPLLATCRVTTLTPSARDDLAGALAAAAVGDATALEVDADGSAALVHVGPYPGGGAVVVFTDTTEARRREEVLAALVVRDPLTGLPNRSWFLERLRTALARDHHRVAVLLCDLDEFKLVNASLGHPTGDRLLVECSRRLTGALRPGQVLARVAGDEFAVLCEDVGLEEAGAVAERLRAAIGTTATIGTATVPLGCSIGVALSRPGGTPDDLIRAADTALYRAKDQGRGRWEVFDASLQARALRRLAIETALHVALERDELELAYQPIVDLQTHALQGVEALLRWRHAPDRLLAPVVFLEAAEDSGLLLPIGRWVVDHAIAQLAAWEHAYPQLHVTVGVNLSLGEVAQTGLVDRVGDVLTDHRADPGRLVVEVTERTLDVDTTATRAAFEGLASLGVRIAIDDFGSGASSLARLQDLPVHVLKIHRTFVERLPHDHASRAIVEATLGLAKALDVSPVAAGIEHAEQAAYLVACGCPSGQGFFFGAPMLAAEVDALLAAGGTVSSPAVPILGSK